MISESWEDHLIGGSCQVKALGIFLSHDHDMTQYIIWLVINGMLGSSVWVQEGSSNMIQKGEMCHFHVVSTYSFSLWSD
jgi:hypothetical protein